MSGVIVDISVSVDGYVAGPDPSLEQPLGGNGEELHEWATRTAAWRESHGLEGGETGAESDLIGEVLERCGATIMGRRMFSGGSGPWEQDPNADAWWGDEPPFHHPVFVLTHHAREPVDKKGGTRFTFVTDGIESALDQARSAAAGKDIAIAGGADVIQQYVGAGVVDEINLHVAPMMLGGGVRLFDGPGDPLELDIVRTVESPAATHVRYRIRSGG